MSDQDFVRPWWVTNTFDGANETCGHQIEIGGGGGAMSIQCVDAASHQYLAGTYQAADSIGPERIEVGGWWITFSADDKSAISYGPSGTAGPITGSWTASDHPWPPDGGS